MNISTINSECLNPIQLLRTTVSPIVRVVTKVLSNKKEQWMPEAGIIVPMINTLDDAKEAINSLYYPPKGNRGVD